jgi:hypothetical protein
MAIIKDIKKLYKQLVIVVFIIEKKLLSRINSNKALITDVGYGSRYCLFIDVADIVQISISNRIDIDVVINFL